MAFRLRRLSLFRYPALLLGAALLLAAVPGFAQDPPADSAAFLIETITVEGARETVARIVVAETLLDEGKTYTEPDLRQAIARVHRLPFVVDANFSLRKGSTRGAYELVIQVDPARWFFFDHEVQESWTSSSSPFGTFRESALVSQTGLIGARAFLGRSGVVYGSYGYRDDDDRNGAQIGYTRYDLFGRGVVANVSYADDLCCDINGPRFESDPASSFLASQLRDSKQLRLNLAVPLSSDQALHFDWTGVRSRYRVFGDGGFESRGEQLANVLEARWVRDTSDDPLLPRNGTTLSAGLEYTLLENEIGGFGPGGQSVELEDEKVTAAVTATRHWPLTPRQSVSTGGRLFYTRDERAIVPSAEGDWADIGGGSVGARHLFRLWSLRKPGHASDLYLETGATVGLERSELPDGSNGDVTRWELSSALVFRNQWGRLRFTASYLESESR